jgi:hypothetical protein
MTSQSQESVAHRSPEGQSEAGRKKKPSRFLRPKIVGVPMSSGKEVLKLARAFLMKGAYESGRKKKGVPEWVRKLAFSGMERVRKSTLQVYTSLVLHMGRDGTTHVSIGTIAAELGYGRRGAKKPKRGVNGERTVRREIGRLVRYGLIGINYAHQFYGGKLVGWRDVFVLLDPRRARYVDDPPPAPRAFVAEVVPELRTQEDVSPVDVVDRSPATSRDASAAPAETGFSVSEVCPPGSKGAASLAALLYPGHCATLSPTLSFSGNEHATAPRPAVHPEPDRAAPPAQDRAASPPSTRSPTPSPAPWAGETPAPRPAEIQQALSPAPWARQTENEKSKGREEHDTCRDAKIGKVLAYFAAKLLGGSLVTDTRNWRRRIGRRLDELERSPRCTDAVAVLLAAVDGVPYGRIRQEDLGDPIKYVFYDATRVQSLAQLGRKHVAAAGARHVGASSGSTAAAVVPPADAARRRARAVADGEPWCDVHHATRHACWQQMRRGCSGMVEPVRARVPTLIEGADAVAFAMVVTTRGDAE